ncbi:MAG: carboxypeptidase-like regulatory domain-containing protein [Vicinamibacterales bacterium]
MIRQGRLLAAIALLGLPSLAVAQDGPRGGPGTVTMTRTDYDRLIDLASRPVRPPDPLPVPAALTRAEIRARVDGLTVRASMQLDGEVFRAGVARVPLIKGATVLEARMGDRPLPLLAEGGNHFALLSGPSTFSATLEVGTTVTTSPGRGTFTLPVPEAGSATVTIDVAGDQTDVRLSTGLILRRRSFAGRTIVEATLDPGASTQVSWSTRDSAPTVAARDVRLLSDIKTLVTIGDADVRLLSLVDINVLQGEPAQLEIDLPPGYEVASVTGPSIDRTEMLTGRIRILIIDPAMRRHQFLIGLEREKPGSSFKLKTGLPSVVAAQRETGEVAVEGVGTLEVAGSDIPGMHRIDIREVDRTLAGVARHSLLAAFRYQSAADIPTLLTLDVRRFPDAPVLAAVAERAIATTLLTSEGRALTEVTLWVRNRAQAFLKVGLPAGASMLSVEVAGEPAKPAEAKDGTRVPLLRPGFRPDGPYAVSFVYLHTAPPFARKGDMQMLLPRMDMPVNIVEWELFVPDRYRVDRFDGNAMKAGLVEQFVTDKGAGREDSLPPAIMAGSSGQIVGRVTDAAGAVVPGVSIIAEAGGRRQAATTDANGVFVLTAVPSGPVNITAQIAGFRGVRRPLVFDQRPRQVDFTLEASALTETVTVTAEAPFIDMRSSERSQTASGSAFGTTQGTAGGIQSQSPANRNQASQTPSLNVQNLQRKAAGVLPVRIDVPRAGTSHRFVKPLVIDEETTVSFRYRRR